MTERSTHSGCWSASSGKMVQDARADAVWGESAWEHTGTPRRTANAMRDVAGRRSGESSPRSSLAEKEELLKEVHHRVKNNLQVIVSLLNMQSHYIEDARMLAQFQEARNRVLAISSIHELLYRADSFGGILLTESVRELAPGLVRLYGLDTGVELAITGDEDIWLDLERAVPFGMLLNELISNACKHGFATTKTGRLEISVQAEANDIVLTVADNGHGLPENFDSTKATSLGLKLVHTLARQLRGEVTVSSPPGTTIQVRFPAIHEDRSD